MNGGNGGAAGAGRSFVFNWGRRFGGFNPGAQIVLAGGPSNATTVASYLTIFAAAGADSAHTGNVIIQDFAGDNSLVVDGFGNIYCACASAVGATDQFLYVGISAGVPTGT